MKNTNDFYLKALQYHSEGQAGKIEVTSTKPCITSQDLSFAYTPGVAAPCLEISKDPQNVYKYTTKGNLVGVITNGSAVLGLGNIGPLASKPVMEGKGILFKRFADIDVFDIEIDETTVEGMVKVIKSMAPTFGGINLEDIKAPECFELERQLSELLDIPVFHDDQHGTAIIVSAAFLNAVEIAGKKMEDVKIVFNGAGAASLACAYLFQDLGVKKENIIICDSVGPLYLGRTHRMNAYKKKFVVDTPARTLLESLRDTDAFIGCSVGGALKPEMILNMNKNPIIFALANPTPEIFPEEVYKVRKDAIMATGRSDFSNQVNNVLGFPFIFRGALDVRATKINKEMKLAAVYALSSLAKEKVTEDIKIAYDNNSFSFGKDYLIPKPFDKRVLTRVATAVAKAAMDSNVARSPLKDIHEYKFSLENRLGQSANFMKLLKDRLTFKLKQKKFRPTILFAEGENRHILHVVQTLLEENKIEPILLGNPIKIAKIIEQSHFSFKDKVQVIDPVRHKFYDDFCSDYYDRKQREGISRSQAKALMSKHNYFGSMLAKNGLVDSFLLGPQLSYSHCFLPLIDIIGTTKNKAAAGVFILIYKDRILFLADCTANIDPNSKQLSEIAHSTAILYKDLLKKNPRIAFLSFSNFGSNHHPSALKVKEATEITKNTYPELIVDGEIQADVAVNTFIMNKLFSFSKLDRGADILIFPELNSANIAYKLLSQLSDTTAIGPLLTSMNKTVNIIQRTASINEIINMTMITALLKEENLK